MITELSRRLGIASLSFDGIEDIWRYQLQDTGVSMADFQQTGRVELYAKPVYEKLSPERLNTASRRIEIINDKWEKAGIASLKPYVAPVPVPGRYRLAIGGCAIHVAGPYDQQPQALFADAGKRAVDARCNGPRARGVGRRLR